MKGKKTRAIILTADRFEDLEVFYPYFRLIEDGISVEVAAPKREKINGAYGYELMPDKTFSEVNPNDYDLLIIPGGPADGGPKTVSLDKRALEIAKRFFADGKTVASVCHGPYTLVETGLVKGRHLTSTSMDGVPEAIKTAGGIYEDKEVVVDGNLITSRAPRDLPFFTKEIMRAIKS